jgi:hypothetical protein
MSVRLCYVLFVHVCLVIANPNSPVPVVTASNELGLTFSHQVNRRENTVTIHFNVNNDTIVAYRHYYFDFHSFGQLHQNEYLSRQRLIDFDNHLRIVGLHDGDYVSCLTFVDEYELVFKPRYACYEFTLGEKTVGSHHGSRSGYLVPLLSVVAFILHVFIAIVHHIKAKNYAHRLLSRFIDVRPRSARQRLDVEHSLKQLDHPHRSASVQRRLSRVSIDPNDDNTQHHDEVLRIDDQLPLYVLPHHSRRVSSATAVMQVIPEHGQSNAMDSVSSMKHLIESTPWIKRISRSRSSSIRQPAHAHG